MKSSLLRAMGVTVSLVAFSLPAFAQAPGDSSMTCRLFPLACPGPTPAPPPPLLGTPEEQVAAAPPPRATGHRTSHKHAAKKHAPATPADQ